MLPVGVATGHEVQQLGHEPLEPLPVVRHGGLGAHGVFHGGAVLCPLGSSTIAAIAIAAGVDVIVLAEPAKVMTDEETLKEMEMKLTSQVADLLSVDSRSSQGRTAVSDLSPPIDRLTPDMYTKLIGIETAAIEEGELLS